MWQSTMIINLTNIDLDYLDVDPATNEIPRITEKWASTLGTKGRLQTKKVHIS